MFSSIFTYPDTLKSDIYHLSHFIQVHIHVKMVLEYFLIEAVVALVFAVVAIYWWKNRRFFELAAKIPQIPGRLPSFRLFLDLFRAYNKGENCKNQKNIKM